MYAIPTDVTVGKCESCIVYVKLVTNLVIFTDLYMKHLVNVHKALPVLYRYGASSSADCGQNAARVNLQYVGVKCIGGVLASVELPCFRMNCNVSQLFHVMTPSVAYS